MRDSIHILCECEPKELWNEIKNIAKNEAAKNIPKA